MSRPLTLLPRNDHLVVSPDRRWPRALLALLLLSGVLLGLLLLVGWPRLASLQTSYRVLKLQRRVDRLEQRRWRLEIELERMRDPDRLASEARRLGLVPPPSAAAPPTPPGGGR